VTEQWEGDGRRAVMQDFAEEARDEGKHFFYVRIPGNVQPIERYDRFEAPLDTALEEAGIGSVTGGGSQMAEGSTVEYCGLDVVVTDRARGIEIIRRVLQACDCPQGAVIEEYLPDYGELAVWTN
jgi:hypothetical protein